MNLFMIIVIFLLIAALANILFYLWFTRRLFGKATIEEPPEEGHFVFRIAGKNFRYSVTAFDHERSMSEPIGVPGTDTIYLYRGKIYDKLEYAVEEMTKRAGRGPVELFLARMGKDIRKMEQDKRADINR